MGTEPVSYCREIEAYLCRKNDGHLIRVVGPSFEIVAGWAASGVPLKVAFEGIDRAFERHARNTRHRASRRPLRIDFCAADVLDAFDEWRRAVGLTAEAAAWAASERRPASSPVSLPEHLERVVLRLSSARASGLIGAEFDALIDRIARRLDRARSQASGLRGAERQAFIAELVEIDREMIAAARASLDSRAGTLVGAEVDRDLAPFRGRMADDAYSRARESAIDRLVRTRFALPTVSYP